MFHANAVNVRFCGQIFITVLVENFPRNAVERSETGLWITGELVLENFVECSHRNRSAETWLSCSELANLAKWYVEGKGMCICLIVESFSTLLAFWITLGASFFLFFCKVQFDGSDNFRVLDCSLSSTNLSDGPVGWCNNSFHSKRWSRNFKFYWREYSCVNNL